MKNTRNLVRFLALVAALAMLVAVSLAVSPLMTCVWALCFLAICFMGMCRSEAVTASSARDGPVPSGDASSRDQFTTRTQRRQWAREYTVGFRSCRLTNKLFDMTGAVSATKSCTMKKAGGPLGLKPAISRKAQCNLTAFNANDQGRRAERWLKLAVPRKAQCNLIAFNANDQCSRTHFAAA